MSAPELPAETVRRGAEKMRDLATAATPGPWHRPLNVRNKAIVTAPLPEGETGNWIGGIDPDTGQREKCCVVLANIRSDGKHLRKRSGRDLEYVAAMDPGVALLIADQWDAIATEMDDPYTVETAAGIGLDSWDAPDPAWTATVRAARLFLGEES